MIDWSKVRYLSVHDASPKFKKELEELFDKLKSVDIKNKSIAVVPNWNLKWDIRDYPEFVNLMKRKEKEGWELVLHGYSHSHPKYVPWYNIFFQSEESWELYKLSYKETKELAEKGLRIFEEAFGHKPKGFIAPNWRLSDEGYKAIKDLGFEYTTSIRHIKYFNKKWVLEWASWYSDGFASFFNPLIRLSALFSRGGRLVLHPLDLCRLIS